MKHKVAELEGESLDLAVAKAQGAAIEHANFGRGWMVGVPGINGARVVGLPPSSSMAYAPSVLWAQGGPIIEREQIRLEPFSIGGLLEWRAHSRKHPSVGPIVGLTPLIAAMRAVVVAKLGAEVELP